MKSSFSTITALTLLLVSALSCNKDECEYIAGPNPGCQSLNRLSLTTGVDENGNPIQPNQGLADPCWRLLNNPPLINCADPLQATINENLLGGQFQHPRYGQLGKPVRGRCNLPGWRRRRRLWVHHRAQPAFRPAALCLEWPFCLEKDDVIGINFLFKGDDRLYFELVDNLTNTVLVTSPGYTYPAAAQIWNLSLSLTAGNYSIRGHLTIIWRPGWAFPSSAPWKPQAGTSCCRKTTKPVVQTM